MSEKKAAEPKPEEPKQDPLFGAHPDRYRAMSVPHTGAAEWAAASDAFQREVAEARIRHRIREVVIVMGGAYLEDDKEQDTMHQFSMGSPLNAVQLLAFAYGAAKEKLNADIEFMLATGKNAARKR